MKRLLLVICVLSMGSLARAQTAPSLGTAATFAVLGSSNVTCTAPGVISGDVGIRRIGTGERAAAVRGIDVSPRIDFGAAGEGEAWTGWRVIERFLRTWLLLTHGLRRRTAGLGMPLRLCLGSASWGRGHGRYLPAAGTLRHRRPIRLSCARTWWWGLRRSAKSTMGSRLCTLFVLRR